MLCKNSFGLYTGKSAAYKLGCTACVRRRACVCMSCELSLFHASHTGLRNKCPYYGEERTQCHLVLVHTPAFLAPWKPDSHSQVIQFPFLPLWLGWFASLSTVQISLCPHIWDLCAFDIIFPVETTCNYGLRGYCGKITNCWLLRMKLSRMSSRALVWSLIYPAAQEHTHPSHS